MGSRSPLRYLVVAFLLCSLALPARAGAESACDSPDSTPGLGVIAEAFNALSSFYVEPIQPSLLLSTAAEAARGEVERSSPGALLPDPPKRLGDGSAAGAGFAAYYCQLWDSAGDDADPSAVAYASIDAMASSLDEAHTNFLTPRQFQAQEAQLSGDEQYEGIGARLSNNPLVVDYVFPGSPAEAAGLRAGDQILSIDGQPAGDMRAEEAVGIVRGPAGTTVTLQIRRPGATADMTIAIVRGTIQIPNLAADVMDDVGVLRLSSFPATRLDEDVAAELARFNDMGAKALVLDLRGNPGGRLDTGVRIASLFLRNGAPVYRETTRSGRMTMRVSSAGPMWTKPIVVLIDRGTASMGELLAAALKEQAGATLIGSNTAGAVAGSITVPLSDGSAMQITTVRIDSSLGAMLNVDGIHPDVNVSPRDPGASRATDPVLDAALTYLRGRVTAPTGAELPAQGSEAVLVAA